VIRSGGIGLDYRWYHGAGRGESLSAVHRGRTDAGPDLGSLRNEDSLPLPREAVSQTPGFRCLFTPGGFENLIEEMSVPAEARTPPPPEVGPPENYPRSRFDIELFD
jgi:hypothetical protein